MPDVCVLVDGGWFEILCRKTTKAKEQMSSEQRLEDYGKPKKYTKSTFHTKETGSAEL